MSWSFAVEGVVRKLRKLDQDEVGVSLKRMRKSGDKKRAVLGKHRSNGLGKIAKRSRV